MSWLIGLALLASGALQLAICWWGSQRRLAPNGVIGLHAPGMHASAAAWNAGHEAAAPALGLGGGVTVCCALAVVTAGLDTIGWVFAALGAAATLVAVTVATVAASRAARGTHG